jgi:hypothetical protein
VVALAENGETHLRYVENNSKEAGNEKQIIYSGIRGSAERIDYEWLRDDCTAAGETGEYHIP